MLTDSTEKNLKMRVDAENGATAGKTELAKKAKALNLDAIHDTVHELSLIHIFITLLVRPRLAVFSTILLSVPVALIAGVSDNGLFNAVTFTVLLMAFVSGPVAVTVLRHRQQRTAALIAGLLVGVTNFLCVIAVGMVNGCLLYTSPESIVRAGFELADLQL